MNDNSIEKQICTYPFVFRIIFRFGNIFVSLFLGIYLVPVILYIDQNYILIIPLVITLLILYFVNSHYITLYKILPYKIIADEEKLICNDFFLSKKSVTIYYDDIESLSGGVFANRLSGVMKICDGRNSVCIGFYQKLRNSNKLITITLSKVKRELYDEVLDKLTARSKER